MRNAEKNERPLNVLVVDDSESMRSVIGYTLQTQGYKYKEAENGIKAIELACKENFDIVITDINMPEMDGMTLTKKLREMPAYKHVVILIVSTEKTDELKQQGREAGATGWVVKPFDPAKLLATIEKCK